jgi:stage V sporulation protein SpoVS
MFRTSGAFHGGLTTFDTAAIQVIGGLINFRVAAIAAVCRWYLAGASLVFRWKTMTKSLNFRSVAEQASLQCQQ